MIYFVTAGGHFPSDKIAEVMMDHNKKAQEVEYKFTSELELKKVCSAVIYSGLEKNGCLDSCSHSARLPLA